MYVVANLEVHKPGDKMESVCETSSGGLWWGKAITALYNHILNILPIMDFPIVNGVVHNVCLFILWTAGLQMISKHISLGNSGKSKKKYTYILADYFVTELL